LQINLKNCGFLCRFCAVFLLTTIPVARSPAAEPTIPEAAADIPESPGCRDSGYLRGRLYGAIELTLDWTAGALQCDGMPRPAGKGVRLRFAGSVGADEHRIAIIIAMPQLGRDSRRTEYASNVTVIEEGRGRFFSTVNMNNCLTDVTALTTIDGDRHAIGGSLYCLAPLAEVNGDSSISITEVQFSGLIDWSAS